MSFPKLHAGRLRQLLAAAVLLHAAFAVAQGKQYTVTAPDGVTIAVEEAGNPDGQAIVFIHGLLGSRLNWESQMRAPQLQRYRLIAYDLRGHGLSGKPADAASYTQGRRWADDLAAVLDAAKAERPVLVGWSLGATVISNYLAAYGDRRIAAAMYVGGVIELMSAQIVPHPEIYRDLNSPDLATHLNAVRDFLALCFQRQPEARTFERLLANAAMASWDMQRAVQSMSLEVEQGLGRTSVPVLLLYGAHDALVKPEPSIARARELNPAVQARIYERAGHAPFLEEAERFNEDLAAFVNRSQSR